MSQPQHERDRLSGFTLLELLIAMSILAALIAMMAGSLSFGATVWEKSDVVAERTSRLMIAQRFLRRQVSEALPLVRPDGRRGSPIAFEGGTTKLKFVTGSLSHAAIGGPYLVDIHLDGSGARKQLVLSWRELAPDLEDFDNGKEEETSALLDGVAAIEISYFGKSTSGQDRIWHNSWEDRNELPLLVRIKLEFEDNADGTWPEFVSATRIQTTRVR